MTETKRDVIFKLLDQPQALRVYINAPEEIYLEKQESFELTSLKLSGPDELKALVQELGQDVGRTLSTDEKAVHFRLGDGKRVAAFRPPGSSSPLVCISKWE
jgi:Flp pilus assembly CpaF family ATPase